MESSKAAMNYCLTILRLELSLTDVSFPWFNEFSHSMKFFKLIRILNIKMSLKIVCQFEQCATELL